MRAWAAVLLALFLVGCETARVSDLDSSATPTLSASSTPTPTPTEPLAEEIKYDDCDEVRAAGKAPLKKGQPGYRAGLDRDGDGVACDDPA